MSIAFCTKICYTFLKVFVMLIYILFPKTGGEKHEMKTFSKMLISFVSAAFCSVLAFSVTARADDIFSDGFADAPAEIPAYQMILSDDFADAPLEISEDMFLISDAPLEMPENLTISDIPSEMSETVIEVTEPETVIEVTEPETTMEIAEEILTETIFYTENDVAEMLPETSEATLDISEQDSLSGDVAAEISSAPEAKPEPTETLLQEIPAATEETTEFAVFKFPASEPVADSAIIDAPEMLPETIQICFEILPVQTEIPVLSEYKGDYQDFLTVLGKRESGNNYSVKNSYGYMGRFQMGNLALQDVGLKDANGNWTAFAHEKYQIYSDDDFLACPEAQDYSIQELLLRNWRTLKRKGAEDHIGETVRGITITKSGLLGAAHLVGAGYAADIFQNQDHADANHTSMYEYLSLMGGYYIDDVIL